MHVSLLKHTWKAPTEYVYTYILITDHMNITDIQAAQKSGKKIVFWGSTPESAVQWRILEDCGIKPDLACDVHCEFAYSNLGIRMEPYWELLAKKEDYFFIITIPKQGVIPHAMKQLFYAGIDEFGIVYSCFSKDFTGRHQRDLAQAFYASINDVFEPIPLFCNWEALANLRRTALEGAGFWDVLYTSIHKLRRKEEFTEYLEIGAGNGIMSLALKKLLGGKINIDWLDIPVTDEKYWQENSSSYFNKLIVDRHINRYYGFIENGDIPFEVAEKKYDCIVLAQVMEHLIFNPAATLKKLGNMLALPCKCHDRIRPAGLMYIAVPNDFKFHNVRSWREIPNYEKISPQERERRQKINNYGHFHEYSEKEAREVFEAADLEVVQYRWNDPINFFILRKKPDNG